MTGLIRWMAVAVLATAWFHSAEAADDAVRTEPVVVTATRIEEKVSEQASAVTVVDKAEIEEKTPALAGDVLQGIPGVDAQRSGSPGGLQNIRIRGGPATGTLVLIDGFPVNSPTLGQFDIGTLPVARFERIEVVRGAQSALYGSNAMSGVVNFIPPSPGEGRRYGGGIFGGSYSTLQGNGYVEGGAQGGTFHLGGAGLTTQGLQPNDDASIVSALGGGDVPVSARSHLHVLMMSTDSDRGVPVDFGSPSDINHRADRRGFLAGGRWETRFSPALSVTASASTFKEKFHEDDPADPGETAPYVFRDVTKTWKTDVGLLARISGGERSDTFVGIEFTRDRATDTLTSNFGDSSTDGSTINRSGYFQEEWRPRKGTGVSVGVRVDGNSQAGTEVNPRLAAYQDLGITGVRLRAAAGRGFRTPTIAEQSDPFIGNPSLAPEATWSYEAGADAVLAEGDVAASGTWFFQSFRDLIQFNAGVQGPAGFGQLLNSGSAFSRGVEAAGSWRFLRAAALSLVYTYTDTWDSTRQQQILGVPKQRATTSLILTPAPDITAQVDWRLESDELDAPPNGGDNRRPGYARVDVYGSYRLTNGPSQVVLRGKVQNLLNRAYEERKGYPSPGINFLLGLELGI